MRLIIIAHVARLAVLSAGRILLSAELPLYNLTVARDFLDDAPPLAGEPQTAVEAASKWDDAVTSGANLYFGMQSDDRKASFFFKTDPHAHDPTVQTVQSTWDGGMKDVFTKWGYNEDDTTNAKIDKECDFETYHKIKKAFDELGIKTASKANGGPNQCVQLDHLNGPTVIRDKDNNLPAIDQQKYTDTSCGKGYRETGATFQFSINGQDGMITLINVISATYSAQRLWKRKPTTDELPQIRSIADVAWGFWNRAGNIQGIKYLLVAMIMNADTRDIIRQAHETLSPKLSETAAWPGFDFGLDTPAGQALLGSPVGRWAGYFLMQHKTQLGANKFINKVRVFKPDQGSLPYMLFYVETPAPPKPPPGLEVRHRVVDVGNDSVFREIREWRKDGRSVVREHVLRVKV